MIHLELVDVHYAYPGGEPVLAGIDLVVDPGESLAVIGANASGKTTLARHLDGLLRPTQGRMLIDGEDATARSVAELSRGVGLCFQDPDRQIFSHTIRDEVEFGLRHQGIEGEERFVRVDEALREVGLGDDLSRHPGDLDTAHRKLLTIASIVALRTPVVVLDEPTVGLDGHDMERVEAIVARLHTDGHTVIAISHDMRFVAESFERVVLLDRGRIALDGPPRDVFAAAQWPRLRTSGLEPPLAALEGHRRGLGPTPTMRALLDAAHAGQR